MIPLFLSLSLTAYATPVDVEQDVRISALESEVSSIKLDLQSVSSEVQSSTNILVQSGFINIARSAAESLPWGDSYVAVLDSSTLDFYVASDITRVTVGSASIYTFGSSTVRYRFSVDATLLSSSSIRFDSSTSYESLSLTPPSGSIVFSDLEGDLNLVDRGSRYAIQGSFILVLSCCLFYFVRRLSDGLRI